MVEQIDSVISEHLNSNNNSQNSVNNIESELSKYSLNDSELSQLIKQQADYATDHEADERRPSSTHSISSSSIDSLPSTNTATSQNNDNLMRELNNGLIHGHIHNFQNFTYIHGHIHTNDISQQNSTPTLSTPVPKSSSPSTFRKEPPPQSQPQLQQQQQQQQFSIDTTSQRRRRRSSHRHSNEPESSQFSDCQHFEFLNCHDKNSILNSDIQCNEDHENCIPKIVEICCDDRHDAQNNLIPNFPSCTDHEQTDSIVDRPNRGVEGENLTVLEYPNKLDLDCALDDCIDIKCDLDTCNIDELYCKYCEDLDQITNGSESNAAFDNSTKARVKIEEKEVKNEDEDHSNNAHNHIEHHHYLDLLNGNILSEGETQNSTGTETTKNDAPVNFTNPMNCINPNCNAFKRHREEDEHPHTLHHHLHHHSFQHSDNHHHHHIQIHDHQPKKVKKSIKPQTNNHDDFINFEWNFKNQGAKCEWENCSTTLDNSFQLQNHIVEDHLLSEYRVPLESTGSANPTGSFECEWKNCDYSGYDLFSLVHHINDTHGFQYDFDINNIFKKNDNSHEEQQDVSTHRNLNFPTPSSDHSSDGQNNDNTMITEVKKKLRRPQCEEVEETKCKWIERNSEGEIISQCNKSFTNAEELTSHLIHDHVGSGKSEYTCLWANCSRNHRNFNQRQKIIRHLHVHTRYKPFVCNVCNHSFAVESMLEQHMRTHSGEKPYKCKICDKHFATSSSLSIHVRTHTGEKPLVCKYPGCGKRFSESSNLTKHIKTHEKFFKCDHCSKSFSKDKQLQSHMAKYHPQI